MDINEACELLASTHPSLKTRLKKEQEYWAPDELLATVIMGDLGETVVLNSDNFSDEQYRELFAKVEKLLSIEDGKFGDAVATGFLEAIMHRLPTDKPPHRVISFFGKEAREYCIAWDEFTGVTTPGLQSIKSMKSDSIDS